MNFFSIGKANAEIDKLTADLKTASDNLKAAEDAAKLAVEDREKIAVKLDESLASNKDISAKLEAATAQIASLTSKVSETEKSVEHRASTKAAEIISGQGHPKVESGAPINPQAGTDLESRLKATDDAYERTRIYRENKSKMRTLAESARR